jgi:hypothetical protein
MAFLAGFCLAMVLAAPAFAVDAPSVAGVWEYKDPAVAANSITFTLNADGTGKVDDDAVTYTVAGNTIKIVTGGETVAYTFKIEGDTMTVAGGDLDKPTPFTRKNATPKKGLGAKIKGLGASGAATDAPKADAPNTDVADASKAAIGRWEFKTDKASLLMTLDADGTGTFNGKPMKWTLKDGVLTTTLGDASMAYQTAIANDTLKLTIPGAGSNTITFARGKTSAADRSNPLDLAGGLAGGGDAKPAAAGGLPGKWEANDGTILLFNNDGTFVFNGQSVPYKAADGKISVTGPAGTIQWAYEVDGDRLTLTLEGDKQTLKRVGAAEGAGGGADPKKGADAGPAAEPKSIVGTWDSPDGGTVIIRADGTTRTGGQEFKYQVDATMITLSDDKNFLKIPYKLDGDKLILGTGPTKTLTRSAGGPAGVYTVTESSLDPQFFMSITHYLSLYPDGNVGFAKSEGGATRTAVTEHLERFSSFKNKAAGGGVGKTYGRWQADANGGVTIQWNGAFKNATWQGRIDPKTGKLILPGAGILKEGDTLAYEKQ